MKRYFYNIIAEKPKTLPAFFIWVILFILSFMYLAAIKLRIILYSAGILKSGRLKSPVISVGNITWGGTGKTPLVERICNYFESRGKTIALLTRGYGSDEDKVLAENMPGVSIIVGKGRFKNALMAQAKKQPDLFILDDGFQHLSIKRNLDILTLNATRPFGNGFLIPAGILREPLTHIRRAQVAVITKSNLVSEDELNSIKQRLLKIKPDMIIYDAIHRPVSFYTAGGDIKRLDYISGKRICAVSALADNTSFVRTLKGLGADIGSEFSYLDHHMYRIDDAEAIVNKSQRAGLEAIVTTQKDWVKLKNLLRAQILARTELLILKIEIKINNEEDFFNRLYLSIFS